MTALNTRFCQANTKAGTPCSAPALKGKKHCALHENPQRAAQLGQAGGRQNRHCKPEPEDGLANPVTAAELRIFIAEAMVKLRSGRLEPKVATSLAYLAGPLLKVIEATELQDRISRLEDHLRNESAEEN